MKEKLYRFLAGRYGVDALWYFLLGVYVVLLIAETIVRLASKGLAGTITAWILTVLMWTVLVLAVYRSFSRNIYRRSAENRAFLRIWTPIKNVFVLQKNKWRDRKTHVYRKCPEKGCGAILRLPKKPGMHSVRCPKCRKLFEVKI